MILAFSAVAGCTSGSGTAPAPAPPTSVTASQQEDKASAAPERGLVARRELIPGKLSVSIFSHVIDSMQGPVPCWTYVSDGLWPLGQQEIVFTVKREPGEAELAYPTDLLQLYALIFQQASRKNLVRSGGHTRLGGDVGLLGRGDFQCVLYTHPQSIEGIPVASPYLTALIVTRNELDAADQFGAVRVMTTLGHEYRFYPTAPWVDRKRRELVSPAQMKGSFLDKVERQYLYSASVHLEEAQRANPGVAAGAFATRALRGRIVLTLRPGASDAMMRVAAPDAADAPTVFMVGLESTADSCLVFRQGQKNAEAISMPGATGARVAGNFLALVPGAKRDLGGVVEDGFVMELTQASWKRIREAILAGKPVEVQPSGDGLGFELDWLGDDEQRPIGSVHYPPPSREQPRAAQRSKEVVLLTPTDQIGKRVEVQLLAEFMKAIDAAVEAAQALPGRTGSNLTVECEIQPGGKKSFKIATQPVLHDAITNGLERRLDALSPPDVREAPVRFMIVYKRED